MSRYGDTGIKPSANRKEHQERTKKCFDWGPLKIGQRVTFVTPAFDFRGGEDDKYGQHTAELVFAKRGKRKAVHTTFFTGWGVTGVYKDSFMCVGLGVHYRYKKDCPNPEIASSHTDCPYTGGKCWFEIGSGIYGETILDRLVNEGSYGVWDEIEQELNSPEEVV
jgi:hypothetical protein